MAVDIVQLIEVGPRDGLQNIKKIIPTATKKKFIDLLIKANLKRIEVTSFVDPIKVPQLSDAMELSRLIRRRNFRFQ